MKMSSWVTQDAPRRDIVVSTRVRNMRNLVGHRFPHSASPSELLTISESVELACRDLGFDVFTRLTTEERDLLVASRLVSPDFDWLAPGCSVFYDRAAEATVMVNEEDHLRIQALTAGWALESVLERTTATVERLAGRLRFAWTPKLGYLAASPYNTGSGVRLSAMVHMVGLSHLKRVEPVVKALAARGLVIRGAFGEATRAVGAFSQVSLLNGDESDFRGAAEYLIREEANARFGADRSVVAETVARTTEYCLRTDTIGLGEAMRALGWLRWAAADSIDQATYSVADVDRTLLSLDIRSDAKGPGAGERRSALIRALIE